MADRRYGRDDDWPGRDHRDRNWRQDRVFNQGYGTGYGGRYGEGGYGAWPERGSRHYGDSGRDVRGYGGYDRNREAPSSQRGWDRPDQRGFGAAAGYGGHDTYGAGRGSLHERGDLGQWRQGGPTSMGGGPNEYGQDSAAGFGWGQRPGYEPREHHDDEQHYRSWREQQMQAFDREYDEFRRHRQERFAAEFEDWRKSRGGPGSAEATHREQAQQSSSQSSQGRGMSASGSDTGTQRSGRSGSRRSGTADKGSGGK